MREDINYSYHDPVLGMHHMDRWGGLLMLALEEYSSAHCVDHVDVEVG